MRSRSEAFHQDSWWGDRFRGGERSGHLRAFWRVTKQAACIRWLLLHNELPQNVVALNINLLLFIMSLRVSWVVVEISVGCTHVTCHAQGVWLGTGGLNWGDIVSSMYAHIPNSPGMFSWWWQWSKGELVSQSYKMTSGKTHMLFKFCLHPVCSYIPPDRSSHAQFQGHRWRDDKVQAKGMDAGRP